MCIWSVQPAWQAVQTSSSCMLLNSSVDGKAQTVHGTFSSECQLRGQVAAGFCISQFLFQPSSCYMLRGTASFLLPSDFQQCYTESMRGLVQGLGLCHGISGNAYALVAAARASDHQQAHQAAVQFGIFMSEHWEKLYSLPDHPSSLFEVSSRPTTHTGDGAFSSRPKKRSHACPLQSFHRCYLKEGAIATVS